MDGFTYFTYAATMTIKSIDGENDKNIANKFANMIIIRPFDRCKIHYID